MSLLRLLTAGRSLVSVRDAETRYRLTSQRLLPQFGSARNPFSGREAASPAPAARLPQQAEPVAAPAKVAAPKPARGHWPEAAAWINEWTGKLMERFSRPNAKPVTPAVPQFNKPPMQGELSLDQVMVVRNDLSDVDLEVVPARKKPAPAVVPVEPLRAAASSLTRVRTRLFGAGKT